MLLRGAFHPSLRGVMSDKRVKPRHQSLHKRRGTARGSALRRPRRERSRAACRACCCCLAANVRDAGQLLREARLLRCHIGGSAVSTSAAAHIHHELLDDGRGAEILLEQPRALELQYDVGKRAAPPPRRPLALHQTPLVLLVMWLRGCCRHRHQRPSPLVFLNASRRHAILHAVAVAVAVSPVEKLVSDARVERPLGTSTLVGVGVFAGGNERVELRRRRRRAPSGERVGGSGAGKGRLGSLEH
mmetsp:Transcript_8104/g.19022  ORF Transcript_8104/g.19022 Transcript_8104/m.19022 type:complete len:245 (-) Transcript_8104:889-1623(-)